jgi:hypothetical protein
MIRRHSLRWAIRLTTASVKVLHQFWNKSWCNNFKRYPLSLVQAWGLFPDISGATTGAERGFFDKTMDFFSPSAREAAGKEAAERAFKETLARATNAGVAESTAAQMAEKAYQAALPGTISKYLPLATGIGAAGIGTGVLPDPFTVPEGTQGKTTEEMIAESERFGEDYLRANPQFAGSFVPSYYPPPTYRAPRVLDQKAWKISPVKTARLMAQERKHPMTSPRCSPMASLFSRPGPFVTWAAEAVVKALPRCTS